MPSVTIISRKHVPVSRDVDIPGYALVGGGFSTNMSS
jgi:hypothetical protein